jgi:general secretion pathway protein D
MIALIPHIVRRPDFTAENLRGIAVGNQAGVHLSYGRKVVEAPAAGTAAPGAAKKEDPTPTPIPPVVPPLSPADQAPATPNSRMSMPGVTTTPPPPPTPNAPAGALPPATAPPMDSNSNLLTQPAGTTPAADQPKPDAAKPAGNVVVHFLQPQAETTPQGMLPLALVIENATDVISAPLQVTFDPKVVKLNDAGRGDYFSQDGQIPVFTKNIQNDAGAAAINLNRLPGTPGVSGSGVLATLIFQAVAKGTTTVSLPNLTVRNSQGQVVFSGTPQMTINVK